MLKCPHLVYIEAWNTYPKEWDGRYRSMHENPFDRVIAADLLLNPYAFLIKRIKGIHFTLIGI